MWEDRSEIALFISRLGAVCEMAGAKIGLLLSAQALMMAEQISRARVAWRAVGCLPHPWGTMASLVAHCNCSCCIPNVIDGAIHEDLVSQSFC